MMTMMKNRAEEQRKHEVEMFEKQRERDHNYKDRKEKGSLLMVNWVDSDQPGEFLDQFERTMTSSEIPREEWPHRLKYKNRKVGKSPHLQYGGNL